MQGMVAGQTTGQTVATLGDNIRTLQSRVGLTKQQTRALGFIAEASSNAGEFLGVLIDKAKEFNMSDIDVENLLEMLPETIKMESRTLLDDIKDAINNVNEAALDYFEGYRERRRKLWKERLIHDDEGNPIEDYRFGD